MMLGTPHQRGHTGDEKTAQELVAHPGEQGAARQSFGQQDIDEAQLLGRQLGQRAAHQVGDGDPEKHRVITDAMGPERAEGLGAGIERERQAVREPFSVLSFQAKLCRSPA